MFEELVEKFTYDFISEYGNKALRKINSKIENSRSVRMYLIKLQEINVEPHPKDLIVTIMNMPFFMMAHREKVAMASILLLLKWNNELNRNSKIADSNVLTIIFRDVLREAGSI
jgi:hypothetical protein